MREMMRPTIGQFSGGGRGFSSRHPSGPLDVPAFFKAPPAAPAGRCFSPLTTAAIPRHSSPNRAPPRRPYVRYPHAPRPLAGRGAWGRPFPVSARHPAAAYKSSGYGNSRGPANAYLEGNPESADRYTAVYLNASD